LAWFLRTRGIYHSPNTEQLFTSGWYWLCICTSCTSNDIPCKGRGPLTSSKITLVLFL